MMPVMSDEEDLINLKHDADRHEQAISRVERVGEEPFPHQTVRADFPHTAFA